MVPVSTNADGICFAFPDVCLTPAPSGPVPLPYPNVGLLAAAQGVEPSVYASGSPVAVETSVIPKSMGDEAGTAGGVKSGTFGGAVKFKTASSRVYAGGKRVVLVGARTSHNNDNAVGQQITPSQGRVFAAS
jgi:hypothetical protein